MELAKEALRRSQEQGYRGPQVPSRWTEGGKRQ
jgi:hypothetical protein